MTEIDISVSPGYKVRVGQGLLSQCGEHIACTTRAETVAVVSDDNVYPIYGERVIDSLKQSGIRAVSFVFPHGECSKQLDTLARLLEFLAESRLTRTDAVAALGGGVTGDMAGFASAVYLRGIKFVQLPTSLLAAVDSSVGGKTAVDLAAGKNLAGAFHQPGLVLCDTDTLDTLPDSFFRDGMAEVIKHGMLCDREMLESLTKGFEAEKVIARNIRIKASFVERDERDEGVRQMLNFGHTIGHAIEKLSGMTVSHGNAVAAGMAIITRGQMRRGETDEETCRLLEDTLRGYSLPTSCQYSAQELCEAALSDKKRRGGRITLVLPRRAGECVLRTTDYEELLTLIKLGLEER